MILGIVSHFNQLMYYTNHHATHQQLCQVNQQQKSNITDLKDDRGVNGRGRLHTGVGRGRRRYIHSGDGETMLLRGGEELHHLEQATRTGTQARVHVSRAILTPQPSKSTRRGQQSKHGKWTQ